MRVLLSATVSRAFNNIAKRLFIVLFGVLALSAEAKQVTITPLNGSAWLFPTEELGYFSIGGDSLFIIRNAGDTCAREALVNIQRIAVEDATPTTIQTPAFPITGRKVLEQDGQIVILKDEKRYKIEGLKIEE